MVQNICFIVLSSENKVIIRLQKLFWRFGPLNKKILLMSLIISTLHLTGCSWNEGEDPTKITSGKFDQELEGLFPSEEI